MGRDRFLKLLKDFDDNYTLNGCLKKHNEDKAKENNQTIKQYLSEDPTTPLMFYSQIDYNGIKQVTMNTPTNPFEPFYNLDEFELGVLFETLHQTNLLLTYLDKYGINRNRKYKERESLIQKYHIIIEDLEAISAKEDITKPLRKRAEGLKTIPPILTKRRIFEHLLGRMCVILDDGKGEKFILSDRIVNITNKIIKNYFNDDTKASKFSRKTDIKNFIRHDYTYETLNPIIVFHSKAQ